jgi:hypothetical protein
LELILRVAVKRYRHNLTAMSCTCSSSSGLAVAAAAVRTGHPDTGFFLALGASVLFGTLLQK